MEEFKLKEMKEKNFYTLTSRNTGEKILVKCIKNESYYSEILKVDGSTHTLSKNIDFQDVFIIEYKSILERLNDFLKDKSFVIVPCAILKLGEFKNGYFDNSVYIGGGFVVIKENQKTEIKAHFNNFMDRLHNNEVDCEDFNNEFDIIYDVNKVFDKLEKEDVELTEEEKNTIVFGNFQN